MKLVFAVALLATGFTASAQVPVEKPPPGFRLRYEYVGYFGENHGEVANCAGSRRNGRLLVEAKLVYGGGSAPDNIYYTGPGRVSYDIDECSIKTVNGEGRYCNMSIVSSYDADVKFEVLGHDGNIPRGASFGWKPTSRTGGTVSGDCEALNIAEVSRDVLAGMYHRGNHLAPIAYDDVLLALAPNGVPRAGTYKDTNDDPAAMGKWTIVLDDDTTSCDPDSIALERARERVDNGSREVNTRFGEVRVLSSQLATDPTIATVSTFLESQQASMTSTFAAHEGAAAGTARDAAGAVYGRAVANVSAFQSANAGRIAAAQVSAVGAPSDPRMIQLSQSLATFDAAARGLASALGDVERYRKQLDDCRRRRGR